eukprot:TRINITY_DN1493_c0_g3_i1.p1 TRINITY_DN1493_c0_g3~~TRINITY_DN1493_c0_g3_i1.p1  ORF type:complete len:399 (+),score=96.88 TRINITY_DN1493_c0_g3_i1:402-1598(+)
MNAVAGQNVEFLSEAIAALTGFMNAAGASAVDEEDKEAIATLQHEILEELAKLARIAQPSEPHILRFVVLLNGAARRPEGLLTQENRVLLVQLIEVMLEHFDAKVSGSRLEDEVVELLLVAIDNLLVALRDDLTANDDLSNVLTTVINSLANLRLLDAVPGSSGQDVTTDNLSFRALTGTSQDLAGQQHRFGDTGDSLQLPPNGILSDAGGDEDEPAVNAVLVQWRNGTFGGPALATNVLSLRLLDEDETEVEVSDLVDPIYFQWSLPQLLDPLLPQPTCVWWEYETETWQDGGCVFSVDAVDEENEITTVQCACDHLTDFGVLVSGNSEDAGDETAGEDSDGGSSSFSTELMIVVIVIVVLVVICLVIVIAIIFIISSIKVYKKRQQAKKNQSSVLF